ncbi:hypothetical protein HCN44_011351 [Aphidius gifuensis]|uniref:Gustatory receptor n=1 Tax=Aphidius gifuensis TaxID=684658 RepID=A0A835CS90_APHGI|nr:uncharacterized protein LOC122851463 [Aphidius gifuensis]KAF7994082.1 hypothetical protein HCN44_011351 [Aphidius gifuensis]
MTILSSCWSPIIWTNNVKTGSKVVASYTTALSFVLITLTIYQMIGGESTQLYNPLFDFDIRDSLQVAGSFVIGFLSFLIISSGLVMFGISQEVRGWLLPWLILWMIFMVCQLLFGVRLLYRYYVFVDVVLITMIDYLWMAYNFYCWLCVYSVYKEFAKRASPNIEYLQWP